MIATSVTNLDRMVQTQVEGISNSTTFYELVLNKLTRYFQQKGYIDMNDALLYDFQNSKEHLTNEQMVDLTVTASFYCAVVRTLATLAIDVEPEYQPYLDRFPLPA